MDSSQAIFLLHINEANFKVKEKRLYCILVKVSKYLQLYLDLRTLIFNFESVFAFAKNHKLLRFKFRKEC